MYITEVTNLEENISVIYRYLSQDQFDEQNQIVYISDRSITLTGNSTVNLANNFEVNIQESSRFILGVGP